MGGDGFKSVTKVVRIVAVRGRWRDGHRWGAGSVHGGVATASSHASRTTCSSSFGAGRSSSEHLRDAGP